MGLGQVLLYLRMIGLVFVIRNFDPWSQLVVLWSTLIGV